MRQADPLSRHQEAGNDSGSEADTGGVLSLEYRDTPFASFMRKIERLIDLDPSEALRMAQTAVTEKIFDEDMIDRIKLKLDQLIDLVHKEEEKPDISGPFTKSALAIKGTSLTSAPFAPAPSPTLSFGFNR